MKNNVLVSNNENFSGQFVAQRNFHDKTVIANGDDFEKVYESAINQGNVDPVVFFVPEKDTAYIY